MPKITMPTPLGDQFEKYWTIRDVADRLHCSVDCVKKWLVLGKLKKTKAGSKTLIAEGHLQQFLAESTKKGSRKAA